MSFVDFLRSTVTLSSGAATGLAAVTVLVATRDQRLGILGLAIAWWMLAAMVGILLGRRRETSEPIARLLSAARSVAALPEQRPARVLLNRLWPLFVSTIAAMAAGLWVAQAPAVGAGFALIWALAWRHQASAVEAIERRDGVRFHLEDVSPLRPIALTRSPGFKAYLPQQQAA